MSKKQATYALRGAVGFALGSAIAVAMMLLFEVIELNVPRSTVLMARVGFTACFSLLFAVALTVGMTFAAVYLRGQGFGWSTLAGAFPFGISFALTFGALLACSATLPRNRLTDVVSSFLPLGFPGLIGSLLLYRYLRVEGARLAPLMLCGFFGFGAGDFLISAFIVIGRFLSPPGGVVSLGLGFVAAFAVGGFVLGLAIDRFREKTVAAHPNGRPY